MVGRSYQELIKPYIHAKWQQADTFERLQAGSAHFDPSEFRLGKAKAEVTEATITLNPDGEEEDS